MFKEKGLDETKFQEALHGVAEFLRIVEAKAVETVVVDDFEKLKKERENDFSFGDQPIGWYVDKCRWKRGKSRVSGRRLNKLFWKKPPIDAKGQEKVIVMLVLKSFLWVDKTPCYGYTDSYTLIMSVRRFSVTKEKDTFIQQTAIHELVHAFDTELQKMPNIVDEHCIDKECEMYKHGFLDITPERLKRNPFCERCLNHLRAFFRESSNE